MVPRENPRLNEERTTNVLREKQELKTVNWYYTESHVETQIEWTLSNFNNLHI